MYMYVVCSEEKNLYMMCVCVYVFMYVYIYIYIYMYTGIHTQFVWILICRSLWLSPAAVTYLQDGVVNQNTR